MKKEILSIKELTKGISENNRSIIGKALTLLESTNKLDQERAKDLLKSIPQDNSESIRIGISGSPGVGKSTFIDTFGLFLIEKGHKVAVITIDPSSNISKGSILGDKTRMQNLANNPNAFIRPSPTGGLLGGISSATYEIVQLFEAANYDFILIETVGVGQSEIEVKELVDYFTLLVLPNSGDDLQGIKRGIMEIANCLLISKVEEKIQNEAKIAKANYQYSMHLLNPEIETPIILTSSVEKKGFDLYYKAINNFVLQEKDTGNFQKNRASQQVLWFRKRLKLKILEEIYSKKDFKISKENLEILITKNKLGIREAINEIIENYISTK